MGIVSANVSKESEGIKKRLPRGVFSKELDNFIKKKFGDIDYWQDRRDELIDELSEIEKTIKVMNQNQLLEHQRKKEMIGQLTDQQRKYIEESIEILKKKPEILEGRWKYFRNEFLFEISKKDFVELMEEIRNDKIYAITTD